jgi:hypothetical protein
MAPGRPGGEALTQSRRAARIIRSGPSSPGHAVARYSSIVDRPDRLRDGDRYRFRRLRRSDEQTDSLATKRA